MKCIVCDELPCVCTATGPGASHTLETPMPTSPTFLALLEKLAENIAALNDTLKKDKSHD